MTSPDGGSVSTPRDPDLLAALREDPIRGLPAVLDRYQVRLLRQAGAILLDGDAAQDVVQESFLRLLGNGHRIDDLPAWLHRVTHNLAVDHLRREARLKKLHVDAAEGAEALAEPADRALDRREIAERLQQEIQGLAPNERAVLYLKVKEGRSYKEISRITGLTTSNVGYLIHQAVKKLSTRLGPFRNRKEEAR